MFFFMDLRGAGGACFLFIYLFFYFILFYIFLYYFILFYIIIIIIFFLSVGQKKTPPLVPASFISKDLLPRVGVRFLPFREIKAQQTDHRHTKMMKTKTHMTYNNDDGSILLESKHTSSSNVYNNSTVETQRFIRIRHVKLEERSGGNPSHNVARWNSLKGNFSAPEQFGQVQRLIFTAHTSQSPLGKGTISFKMYVYIGSAVDQQVNDPEAFGYSMLVPARSVKFCVRVQDWPFQHSQEEGSSNRLAYQLVVESGHHTTTGPYERPGPLDVVGVGTFGEVIFPRSVEVDGQLRKLESTTSFFRGSIVDRSTVVDLTFPAGNDIRYDPDIVVNLDLSGNDHSDPVTTSQEKKATEEEAEQKTPKDDDGARGGLFCCETVMTNMAEDETSDRTWLYVLLGVLGLIFLYVVFFRGKKGGFLSTVDEC